MTGETGDRVDVAARLRRATLWTLAATTTFATAALLIQLARWEALQPPDLLDAGKFLLVFWSPYVALMVLTLWLSRDTPRAAVLFAGSLLVAAWGVFWHLDILVFRPDVMSQILSPLLIPGMQWSGVVGTAVLALLAGLIRRYL